MFSSRLAPSRFFFFLLPLLCVATTAFGDPPANPPPCSVQLGPVFCFRTTDIQKVPNTSGRYRFEFLVVNWTRSDVGELIFSLNTGATPGLVPPGAPRFSAAFVDNNGRPIGPDAESPSGNLATSNDWSLLSGSSTRIRFGGGTALPHPRAFVGLTQFDGLLDPDFAQASQFACATALMAMIPGSQVDASQSPPLISVPDVEFIDDGTNVLDGFVVEISDWDPGEQFSFNWHFVAPNGDVIGSIADGAVPGNAVMGDEYGFGTCNLALLSGAAPGPLFDLNSGYDPPDDTNPNLDTAMFWAENEQLGLDTYLVNPIPTGQEGEGDFFAVELGAATTAEFADPSDNSFVFNGQPIQSGINIASPIFTRGDCNVDGSSNVADVVFLLSVLFPAPGCVPDTDGIPDGSPECPWMFCQDACDGNDDGNLNIADSVVILTALFGMPAVPLPNATSCNPDTTEDGLSCARFAACP